MNTSDTSGMHIITIMIVMSEKHLFYVSSLMVFIEYDISIVVDSLPVLIVNITQ